MKDRRESSTQRGYDKKWIAVREMKLRANPLCEDCDKGGLTVEAAMVHHIIPIKGKHDPLRLYWDNLMSLCLPCHGAKHNTTGKENVGGCRTDGLPMHKEHPWNK